GTKAVAARAVRRARQARTGRPGDLPGDAGGNGRHDAIAREFLYEEIPATGVYRLQRWAQGQQLAAHGRLIRLRTPRPAARTEIATRAAPLASDAVADRHARKAD